MSKIIIDISRYQTVTDWKAVADAVEGVFIKATEGQGFIDPKFVAHAQAAQAAKIPKGFYHFASLNDSKTPEADARAEARDFLKATAPFSKELPYVLDLETNKADLSRELVEKWVAAFFSELEKHGVTDYVLYSYAPFLDTHLPRGHKFGNIRLWLAAYVKSPRLPRGWSSYWLWQYSSKGSIPGINGNVDVNRKP